MQHCFGTLVTPKEGCAMRYRAVQGKENKNLNVVGVLTVQE
jgi:hypothetical protein